MSIDDFDLYDCLACRTIFAKRKLGRDVARCPSCGIGCDIISPNGAAELIDCGYSRSPVVGTLLEPMRLLTPSDIVSGLKEAEKR